MSTPRFAYVSGSSPRPRIHGGKNTSITYVHMAAFILVGMLSCASFEGDQLVFFAPTTAEQASTNPKHKETNDPLHTKPGEGLVRADQAEKLLVDLNTRRRTAGLTAVVIDPKLSAVAGAHAKDMIARHYFGHDSPEGLTSFDRIDQAGLKAGYEGENLAVDTNEPAAERALYNSPDHRDNTLEPHYLKVGIAVVQTSQGMIFVEDFTS